MKKAILYYALCLGIILISLHCSKTSKQNSVAKWHWQAKDSLTYINQIIDSFYYSTQLLDTNKTNVFYKKIDDTLDLLASNKATDKKLVLNYYDIFLKTFSNNSLNDSFFIKKKTRILRLAIYYNRVFDNNAGVINYYKQLISNPYKKYVPDEKLINSMHEVGIAYNKIGDNEKTEQTYLATLQLAKQINSKEDEAKSIVNLNVILDTKQLHDSIIKQSAPLLKDEIKILDKIKASLSSSIAHAYLQLNNLPQATIFANKAFALLQNIDSTAKPSDYQRRMGVIYKTFANVATAKNKLKEADIAYSKAIDAYYNYDSSSRDLGKIFLNIAKHKTNYSNSSFTQPSIYYINKALFTVSDSFDISNEDALPNTIKPENTLLDALIAKANYYKQQPNFSTNIPKQQLVLACFKKAFQVEKKLLNSFEYDNAKINFINESHQYTKEAVAICHNLYSQTQSNNWVNEALQFIENNKATVLLNKLKQNKILLNIINNDTITKQLATLKSDLFLYKADGNENKIKETESEIEALNITLEQAYPQLKQNDGFNNAITTNIIQKKLNKHTSFVEYLIEDEILYSVVVEKEKVFFNKSKLNIQQILQYKIQCGDLNYQQTQPAQFFNTSYQLYKSLFPQQLNSKTKELIIAADGILNNFSFESLICKPFQNLSNNQYVVQQYVFNYCYSYNTLNQKLNQHTTTQNILVCTPATNIKLRNQDILQHTTNEAKSIQVALKNVDLLNANQAIASDFIKKYDKYDIVHLATHATQDSITGNSIIDFFDKPIQANQLQENNTINTKLFFLSACETTLGKNTNTEGALSLARSLYYAGAQNVIASQWKINDETTAQLVAHFYKNIESKKFANALHLAKNNYLQQNSSEKKLPYYWASLVSIGYQESSGFKNYYWFALIGIILFFISTVFLLKYRKGKQVKLR
jgi:CHAT domain-containing protein